MDDANEQVAALIGKGIRQARKAAGFTQYQLAELTGIPQGKISHYENGQYRASPEVWMAIDKALKKRKGYVLRLAGLVEDEADPLTLILADPTISDEGRDVISTIYAQYRTGTGCADDSTASATATLSETNGERPPAPRRRPGRPRSA